jgi:hypothetical protein
LTFDGEIVIAAFSIEEDKAVFYRKYKTLKGFQRAIKAVIESLNPDYISVRIIKKGQKERTEQALKELGEFLI